MQAGLVMAMGQTMVKCPSDKQKVCLLKVGSAALHQRELGEKKGDPH